MGGGRCPREVELGTQLGLCPCRCSASRAGCRTEDLGQAQGGLQELGAQPLSLASYENLLWPICSTRSSGTELKALATCLYWALGFCWTRGSGQGDGDPREVCPGLGMTCVSLLVPGLSCPRQNCPGLAGVQEPCVCSSLG